MSSIEHEMVTCCGVIAGTTRALLDYLYAFIKELRVKVGCHPVGTDTAVHVKIIHDVLKGVHVVDHEHSLITHNPSPNREDYEGEIDPTTGGIFNNDGRLYALVHQYDRCPSLIEPYHKRHDISNESEEFKHSVGVKVIQPSQNPETISRLPSRMILFVSMCAMLVFAKASAQWRMQIIHFVVCPVLLFWFILELFKVGILIGAYLQG